MREVLSRGVKAAALSILRDHHALRTTLLRVAAARRRALVLCYHTIGLAGPHSLAVPAMNPDEFDAQMTTLKSIGEVVPLDWLLQRGRRVPSRPHFAITFDDDDPAHINGALPILQKHQIQATFFLSGRSLHGLGPYWWTALEQSARAVGLEATCHAVGVHARTLKELIRGCRNNATVKELPVKGPATVMSTTDIRMLSDAGMSIGFHTVTHPALTRLSERDLREAVTVGRDALAALARAPVDLFAYPYGDVDGRVADAVRAAGYTAAFALRHRPVHAWCDRFNVPRWQPASFGVVDFAGETALRLSRRVSRLGISTAGFAPVRIRR